MLLRERIFVTICGGKYTLKLKNTKLLIIRGINKALCLVGNFEPYASSYSSEFWIYPLIFD